MEILPLPETGHQGYLLISGRRALAVDPPLDIDAVAEFLPGWVRLTGVVETGVPGHRVAGGRPLATELEVPFYGPGSAIRGARLLAERSRVPEFPEVSVLAAPGRGASDIAMAGKDVLFVGDLDSDSWAASAPAAATVGATRRRLAEAYPRSVAHGSTGIRPGAQLTALPTPRTGRPPLNHEAIDLTNRGNADMFWADPRYGSDAAAVTMDHVGKRLGSPWSPTIVDLRTAGDDMENAVRVAPARLASELGSFGQVREVVVLADTTDEARLAAGLLARLGMQASYVA